MNLFKKIFGKKENQNDANAQEEKVDFVYVSRKPRRQNYGKKGLSIEDLEWSICPIGYPENDGLSFYTPRPEFEEAPDGNVMPQIIVEDKNGNTKKETIEKETTGIGINDKSLNGKSTSEKATVPVLNIGDNPKKIFLNTEESSNKYPKRVVAPVYQNAKLTILLVENSEEVAKIKDKLEVIVKSLGTTGFVYVINYGNSVRETTITEASTFSSKHLLCEEYIGNKMCLYDALVALKEVVKKYYNQTEWLKYRKVKINTIDVIGIGRCIDNCSVVPFEMAIDAFNEATAGSDVVTKYFCLTEENFINTAAIGFHSIGAIAKNNT